MGPTGICILHNIIAPYRLPLFEQLDDDFGVHALFCQSQHRGRLWNPDVQRYGFEHEILRHMSVGPFVINYTLLSRLIKIDAPVHIVGEASMSYAPSILVVLLYAKLKGRAFIVWSETVETRYSRRRSRLATWAKRLYARLIYRAADALIAQSEMTKRWMMENGAAEDRIFVVPYVMPTDLLKPGLAAQHRDGQDKTVVLTLSYLTERKGIHHLIQAFRQIEARDVELWIAGAGEDRDRLEALADGDDRIRFLGYVEGEEKARCYQQADVFVLPSQHDPWGLVVNEAMEFGLPVITTDATGAAELISDNGVVVEAGNVDELRGALARLLEAPEPRKAMGERSESHIDGFDVDTAVKGFTHAIQHATSAKASGTSRDEE